jgi:crotonobetaine/carnitine-CoA ligase
LERLQGALDGSTLEHIVVVGGDAVPPDERRPGITYWTFEEALAAPARHVPRKVAAEDTAVCLYTGGTTGPSKGCVLSHVALVHHSITPARAYGRTSADVFWTPLPLFHLNAIKFGVIGGLVCGGRSVISKKFSLSGFWNEIATHQATIANLLGSMAALIARSPHERHDETLRLLIAVPLPQDADALLRNRFGIDTWSGFYGMTECSTIGLLPHGVEHRPASAGLVNAEDYDVRIFDDAGNEVAPGETGEIVARPRRPDIMFKGYWNKPEATLRTFTDCWFRSGDIGRIDADGYLYFVDRKGDYLRRRGENVSTTEVEAVLVEHPDVVEVAVHAVPSDIAEDDIKVTAVLKPGAALDAPAFFDWMRERLPYFALPTYIEFRSDLPRSHVGRVLKRELRAEGVTPATWSRETAGAVFERR